MEVKVTITFTMDIPDINDISQIDFSYIHDIIDRTDLMNYDGGPVNEYDIERTGLFNLELIEKKTHQHYQLLWDGEMKVTLDTFVDLGGAFIAALILIFLLMVVYYKSFALSGIVLLGSFLSIIGVIIGHWIMDLFTADTFFLTATSLIGFIALIGISSRNSLLLIDFTKSLMLDKNKDFYGKLLQNLKLVLFDECHNISAPTVFKFFDILKKNKVNIIGLSATPIRTNKSAKTKAIEIFSVDKVNINIIYTFDLFEGIRTNTTLPFKIKKYEFKGKIRTTNINKSDDSDTEDVIDIINSSDDTDDTEIQIKKAKQDKIGFEDIEYKNSDNDYNKDLDVPLTWLTSAKEFMFWTTQNWSANQNQWKQWLKEWNYKLIKKV